MNRHIMNVIVAFRKSANAPKFCTSKYRLTFVFAKWKVATAKWYSQTVQAASRTDTQDIPSIYGTQRLIPVFTKALH
jgi:hypothetical protein